MKILKAKNVAVLLLPFTLASCAGNRATENPAGDSACAECGEQGEMELEVFDERGFVELNPNFLDLEKSSATIGSFPALNVMAECPDGNKICHSFSEDAVDFDLAHFEDSLFERRFPTMRHEQMLEGLRIPEADSSWIREALKKMLGQEFADGKKLSDVSPWESRADSVTAYSVFDRDVPQSLRAELLKISRRYNVRYLTLPVTVQVKILPKLGKSGGFAWKSLWTLWDARLGKPMLLSYHAFTAKTRSRVAPERGWAAPFAERLARELFLDPESVENH